MITPRHLNFHTSWCGFLFLFIVSYVIKRPGRDGLGEAGDIHTCIRGVFSFVKQ